MFLCCPDNVGWKILQKVIARMLRLPKIRLIIVSALLLKLLVDRLMCTMLHLRQSFQDV